MPTEWTMGLLGGLLIGGAAAIFLLINGRVMGASGIIGGLVDRSGLGNWPEKVALIAGLIIVPALMTLAMGVKPTYLSDNLLLVALAGVFVGVGTHSKRVYIRPRGLRDQPAILARDRCYRVLHRCRRTDRRSL